MFVSGHSNWFGLCVRALNDLLLCGSIISHCAVDRNWPYFGVGIGSDFVLVGGGRNHFGFVWIEIDLVLVSVSELTWLYSGYQNWLDFSVGVEKILVFVWRIEMISILRRESTDVVFVWVVNNNFSYVWGNEIDLTSISGSELTWYLCRCRKWPVFNVGLEIGLFCVGASKFSRVKSGDRNWLDISVGVDSILVFVWVVEFDLISVDGRQLTWF